MSNDLPLPNPERFGLSSFADILPKRDPIIGEDPGSLAAFRDGMMRALVPFTPYECVVAENLIDIEWELLQRRRMRDASLRQIIHTEVRGAVMERERALHDERLDAAWEEFIQAGGKEHEWEDPFDFDRDAAGVLADEVAERSLSHDPGAEAAVHAEIAEMGLDPVKLMSDAYIKSNSAAMKHDEKIQELERRRREVKRDYDALQKTRPIDGAIIGG
ncbi:hypothetical protein [Aestuariivita boseongensis]|uniref:hypothetical protein n=1 Tax=Aestuariivita boseongensis TaxID=1470562 RepID=UPI00068352D2|nr:hypothetical protein [Aestuariivita boseongensis]